MPHVAAVVLVDIDAAWSTIVGYSCPSLHLTLGLGCAISTSLNEMYTCIHFPCGSLQQIEATANALFPGAGTRTEHPILCSTRCARGVRGRPRDGRRRWLGSGGAERLCPPPLTLIRTIRIVFSWKTRSFHEMTGIDHTTCF